MGHCEIVTSFSRDGYERYGRDFIESCGNLPYDVTVYSEDDLPIPHKKLDDPVHLEFLKRRPGDPPDYRFQAKRFSYKTFSVLASKGEGRLIWLDADVKVFGKVPAKFLDDFLPKGVYTAYLGREKMHSECGFVIYDRSHPVHEKFMSAWRNLYETDGLFKLKEWHDSFVYDHLRTSLNVPSINISGPGKSAHHPFINSPLGKYMDHFKGNRKEKKRSSRGDLSWNRPEAYWRAL